MDNNQNQPNQQVNQNIQANQNIQNVQGATPEQAAENVANSMTDPEMVDLDTLKDILINVPNEKIDQWKNEGYEMLFKLDFMRETYVYRHFNYIEYKKLRNEIKEQYKDNVEAGDEAFKEALQKKCVMWPENYQQRLETGKPHPIPAGIAFLLGDYILASSGFAENIVPDVVPLNSQ